MGLGVRSACVYLENGVSCDSLLKIDDTKYFSMALWREGILHIRNTVVFKPMIAGELIISPISMQVTTNN